MAGKLEHERDDGWRKYVRVSGRFPEIDRIILENQLDKMYREILEFRLMLPDSQISAEGQRDQKVLIRPPSAREEDDGPGARSDGVIILDPHWAGTAEYRGQDGQMHPLTLRRVLFHEFVHLADPASHRADRLLSTEHDKLDRQVRSAFLELPVKGRKPLKEALESRERERNLLLMDFMKIEDEIIEPYTRRKTNKVMFRHYHEPFREEQNDLPPDNVSPSSSEKELSVSIEPVHDSAFIPLPVVDVPDPKNRRSERVETIYREHLGEKSWREKMVRQREERGSKKRPPGRLPDS